MKKNISKEEQDKIDYEKFKLTVDAQYKEMKDNSEKEKQDFQNLLDEKEIEREEYNLKRKAQYKLEEAENIIKEEIRDKKLSKYSFYLSLFSILIYIVMPLVVGLEPWGEILLAVSAICILFIVILTGPLAGFLIAPFLFMMIIGGIYKYVGSDEQKNLLVNDNNKTHMEYK